MFFGDIWACLFIYVTHPSKSLIPSTFREKQNGIRKKKRRDDVIIALYVWEYECVCVCVCVWVWVCVYSGLCVCLGVCMSMSVYGCLYVSYRDFIVTAILEISRNIDMWMSVVLFLPFSSNKHIITWSNIKHPLTQAILKKFLRNLPEHTRQPGFSTIEIQWRAPFLR